MPFLSSGRTMAANMGSMRILIKGGKVVNDDFTHEADVYIENGIIQQVSHIFFFYKWAFVQSGNKYKLKYIRYQTDTHIHSHSVKYIHSCWCDSFLNNTV